MFPSDYPTSQFLSTRKNKIVKWLTVGNSRFRFGSVVEKVWKKVSEKKRSVFFTTVKILQWEKCDDDRMMMDALKV